ncbi:N-(5'-phosphoribosyl)anthranilate isomerase [compost metagenome]
MKLKLKVCGLREPSNIVDVAALHPDYMGFIFYPRSARFAGGMPADDILTLPDSIKTTGVFVNASLTEIKNTLATYRLNAVQLHGDETPDFCMDVKQAGAEVIKAFGIDETFDFNQLNAYTKAVDYFLFDTRTVQHGGSGILFDWKLLQKYTGTVPFFLSGGIGNEQLIQLKQINHPALYAVDVNSKFESAPGIKNIKQLKFFLNELHA